MPIHAALFCLVLAVMTLSGCAVTQEYEIPEPVVSLPRPSGVYHKVQKGETLWRIARTYQVDIDDIISSNRIPDVANIERNQLVFIPGADQVLETGIGTEDINKDEFIWPIEGKVLGYFGGRQAGYSNKGISIQASEGQSVRAAREGRVVFADYLAGYGYTVILDHLDGYTSTYSQNSKLLIKVGDTIVKGQPVAQVGQRGGKTFVYFEIRKRAVAENPLYYLPRL